MMWTRGMVVISAVLSIGATCVDQGPIEQQDAPVPSSSATPGGGDIPDGAGTQEISDEHPDASDSASGDAAGSSDARQRGTVVSGMDATEARAEVIRVDGTREVVVEDEFSLYPGTRAILSLTVRNDSDGWVPINFELCLDDTEALALVDPDTKFDTGPTVDEACTVRYVQGEWPILERGVEESHEVGAVVALPHAAGGYLTIYFRTEFEALGEIDLIEYTMPYRVLPP